MSIEENKKVFVLVHGGGQSPECFADIQPELTSLGYRSIAPNLPISDPKANFDDYAEVVRDTVKTATKSEKIGKESDIILVGHSRGANVIPRVAVLGVAGLAVKNLIFVCPSFEPSTVAPLISEMDFERLPRKRTKRYEDAIITVGGGLADFNPDMVRDLLFAGCTPEVQDRALKQLRLQRRDGDEPILDVWPDHIPQTMVYSDDDRVINPEWSRAIADILNIEPIKFEGGHFPFLSRPKELARRMISLVE